MHHEILTRGESFAQVKSVVIKISFSKGGVMLQYAPMKFWLGGCLFGQVKSVVIKIFFGKGGVMLQYAAVKF